MLKTFLTSALLITSISAHSSIVLQSGESFSSSFNLTDDGEAFKITDFYWDAGILLNFSDTSADVTFTAYEDTAGTQQVFSGSLFEPQSGLRTYLGSPMTLFSDLDGRFTITNNGTGDIEVIDIIISNFAGNTLPSNIATATITPSAVPVPAAVWLFGSGLIGLLGISRRKH